MKKDKIPLIFTKYRNLMQSFYDDLGIDKKEEDLIIIGSQAIWFKHESMNKYIEKRTEMDIIPEGVMGTELENEASNYLEHMMGAGSLWSRDINWNGDEHSPEEQLKLPDEDFYHIDVVDYTTPSTYPKNWKSRIEQDNSFQKQEEGGLKLNLYFARPSDLILGKAAANRHKDNEFLEEIFRCNIVSMKEIRNIIYNGEMNHLEPDSLIEMVDKLNNLSDKFLNPSKKIDFDKIKNEDLQNLLNLQKNDFELPNNLNNSPNHSESLENPKFINISDNKPEFEMPDNLQETNSNNTIEMPNSTINEKSNKSSPKFKIN